MFTLYYIYIELSLQCVVKSGSNQGDALSPILFYLAFEKVIRDISVRYELKLNGNNVMLTYAETSS